MLVNKYINKFTVLNEYNYIFFNEDEDDLYYIKSWRRRPDFDHGVVFVLHLIHKSRLEEYEFVVKDVEHPIMDVVLGEPLVRHIDYEMLLYKKD